jgi:hypothetical protein
VTPTPSTRPVVWILGCFLSERDQEALIGDLVEECVLRSSSHSTAVVSWWCWCQLSRSIPPLLWSTILRGQWLVTLGVAIGASVLVQMIESLGNLAVWRLLTLTTIGQQISSLVVGLTAIVCGAYIGARIRTGTAAALACLNVVAVANLMLRTGDAVPLWYQLGFLILGPLAALAGGALSENSGNRGLKNAVKIED